MNLFARFCVARFCIALATVGSIADHAVAEQIDFSTTPHWQELLTVADGQSTATSPQYAITLAQDSFVTIRVGIDSQIPFAIAAEFDGQGFLQAPNQFNGSSTEATFAAELGAGVHEFDASFSLPSASGGTYSAQTRFDFSAAPVPEPSNALMLFGGLACLMVRRGLGPQPRVAA